MQRTIIGLVGPIGHGKSSVAERLASHHGFERGSFALALKEVCCTIFVPLGAERRHFFGTQEDKDEPIEALGGTTGRRILQVVGSEGFRAAYADVWVRTALEVVYPNTPLLAFDDVRFPDEARCIRDAGGVVVKVLALGKPVPEDEHQSEQQRIDHTYAITAPVGHMDYLQRQVDDFAKVVLGYAE